MTPANSDSRVLERERLREAIRQSMKPLDGIYPVDRYEGEVKIGRLRRRGSPFSPRAARCHVRQAGPRWSAR